MQMANKSILYQLAVLPFAICFATGFIGSNPETEATQFIQDTQTKCQFGFGSIAGEPGVSSLCL